MSENDQDKLIPRNLNTPEIMEIGPGLKFKILDLPILCGSGTLGYFMAAGVAAMPLKSVIIGLCVGAGYLATKIKFEGQSSWELLGNFALYESRKIMYNNMKGDVNNEKQPRDTKANDN